MVLYVWDIHRIGLGKLGCFSIYINKFLLFIYQKNIIIENYVILYIEIDECLIKYGTM